MTRQELIRFCLTFPDSYEDYPFDSIVGPNSTTVMRHRGNKKSFALMIRRRHRLYLNVKCEPFEADFLRQAFRSEVPGYHMSHVHWNSIILGDDCDVPEEEIKRQIENSYHLTKPKAV